MKITEPAVDLGMVLAIVSSFRNRPIDEKTVAFGEVGLSGEVRAVSLAQKRVQEAQKLGFTTCILPKANLEGLKDMKGIKLVGVSGVQDAIAYID